MATRRPVAKSEPPDHIPQLMTRVLAATNQVVGRDLANYDLSPQAARALVTLMARGPIRVSLLAELVGLEPTGLSHLMRTLDQRGLLRRERDSADHRSVLVMLTPTGRTLARRCADIQSRRQNALLRQFSADETNRIRTLLYKMIDTLSTTK